MRETMKTQIMYRWRATFQTKKTALALVEELESLGMEAKVRKTTAGYSVFVRPTERSK